MQSVIHDNIHSALHRRLCPEIADRVAVQLITIKGLNPVLGEKDVAVDVCAKHQRFREELPPTTERGSRPPHHSHGGGQMRIVRTKAEFKNSQWAVTKIPEEFPIDRCVIVLEAPLVASVSCHDAAHWSRGEGV